MKGNGKLSLALHAHGHMKEEAGLSSTRIAKFAETNPAVVQGFVLGALGLCIASSGMSRRDF